jgi:hypothetical protein
MIPSILLTYNVANERPVGRKLYLIKHDTESNWKLPYKSTNISLWIWIKANSCTDVEVSKETIFWVTRILDFVHSLYDPKKHNVSENGCFRHKSKRSGHLRVRSVTGQPKSEELKQYKHLSSGAYTVWILPIAENGKSTITGQAAVA